MLAKSKAPKTPESPQRDAARRFLDVVQAKIIASMPSHDALKLNRWKNPRSDELYGWQGGGFGNVYLNVLADGTDLSPEFAVLHATVSFWVVVKNRRACARWFDESMLSEWARRLDLGDSKLEIAEDRRGIAFEEVWSEPISTLADKIAAMFCRFLDVFRPNMEGNVLLPADDSESDTK